MQQLDIFADSIQVQYANALIAELSRFDPIAARRALESLGSSDPNSASLSSFQVLVEFLEHWRCDAPSWPRTPAAIAAAVQFIPEKLLPAARMMGASGTAFVRKIYADLAKASEMVGIDPKDGDSFAAELYWLARQFRDVVRTATPLPGAEMRSNAQRWLALGHNGLGDAEPTLVAVLRYALLAPDRFGSLVEEMDEAALSRDWRNFQDVLGDLDASWFPAWCAHEKRHRRKVMDNLPSGEGPMAYRLIVSLNAREREGLSVAVIEDRQRLKRLDETFFSFYLRRRADLHSHLLQASQQPKRNTAS